MGLLNKTTMTFDEVKLQFKTNVFDSKEMGSAVMILNGEFYATIWIGVNNVSLMINKEEIKSFKFLIQ